MTISTDHGRASRELCRILRHERENLAEVFASAFALMPRWKPLLNRERSQWGGFLQTYFFGFVDYLVEYFRVGDVVYKQLYVDGNVKAQYDPDVEDATRKAQTDAINRVERQGLEAILQAKLSPDA